MSNMSNQIDLGNMTMQELGILARLLRYGKAAVSQEEENNGLADHVRQVANSLLDRVVSALSKKVGAE